MINQIIRTWIRAWHTPDSEYLANRITDLYEWLIIHGYSKSEALEHIQRIVEDGIFNAF